MNNAETQLGPGTDVLSPTYYRDNFLYFLSSVERRYRHLLSEDEAAFVVRFQAVSFEAQCLFVRLISRKGPLFRVDKLNYPEIGDLDAPLEELATSGLLVCNPLVPLRQLLELLTLPELKGKEELARLLEPNQKKSQWRSLRKRELVDLLCSSWAAQDEDASSGYRLLGPAFRVVSPAHDQILACFNLLFFGNLGQDLTEFVLRDLGVVRYEPYALDGAATAYRTREEVDALLRAYQWRQAVYQALETEDQEALAAVSLSLPESDFLPARRTLSKGINLLARHSERGGDLVGALALYRHSTVAPARERIARILCAAGDWDAARTLCNRIVNDPWNEQEATAARRIHTRCLRQLGLAAPTARSRGHRLTTIELRTRTSSVELQALAHRIQTRGGAGFYVENWLFNALFGLLFWDIVFAPVADAFYHPFQRGPKDLYRPEFRHKRDALLRARLEQAQDARWLKARVAEVWSAKFGTANPFVFWTSELEPCLSIALERVPPAHLLAVFARMLTDLRHHCSGFPDLIWFPAEGGYELLEVKGPGDRVQDNQARWLDFFLEQDIPARVVQVVFTGDDDGIPTDPGSSATL